MAPSGPSSARNHDAALGSNPPQKKRGAPARSMRPQEVRQALRIEAWQAALAASCTSVNSHYPSPICSQRRKMSLFAVICRVLRCVALRCQTQARSDIASGKDISSCLRASRMLQTVWARHFPHFPSDEKLGKLSCACLQHPKCSAQKSRRLGLQDSYCIFKRTIKAQACSSQKCPKGHRLRRHKWAASLF